ncbi:MAG: tRNA guanosine(34) transglycosylase Tgt [Geothrix sp.]|uniref:tRNA guanosine(34) transglycosylase Tgt n=1 Tax=Geothrix sp. TaxID=1962974 RepID=UPI0017F754BA|nr:tRNA guanosine(34) transglycosylase Tgt [Geothrix sp.]NWJ42325.1 tRNA guanosine(34) transglycosylase Tgt [Geothrix sp.]WIL19707.1 MAG: tRNA guanosine(34) transglycosylase Tgt [Geothrix sp.]
MSEITSPEFTFRNETANHAAAARAGHFRTGHGEVLTPAFMPVGTQGTVKGITPVQLREIGPQVILGNTYHLGLRPGDELVARLGGLHRLMGWEGPILTDSGGFQVFSLASLRKMTEDGVTFQSHVDGSPQFLSPERSLEIQRNLGSDICMALDECPPGRLERSKLEVSMARTTRWLARSRAVPLQPHQGLFAINQGGTHLDLRRRHLEEALELDAKTPFQGFAVGGLSVGEPKPEMNAVLAEFVKELPGDRPRYLMGVGTPEDLLFGIEHGVDLFDCVLPSREARHGRILTSRGRLNLKNARHREADLPLDPDCPCYTCRTFSRAYLHHLLRCGELLGFTLNTIHNLSYTVGLTRAARQALLENRFPAFAQSTRAGWLTEEP